MGQQVFAVDTVGYGNTLGEYFDFYVNNTFYLLAPQYYYSFYAQYLNRCLSVYDGWVSGWHNKQSGLVPQRMLQSVARGLNNMVFAHGTDFSNPNQGAYEFARRWAKKSKITNVLKKAHLYAIAGGTALIKTNRCGKDLFVTAHRIDTFFADFDSQGKIVRVRVYYDAIHNTKPGGGQDHYGICEERYFNEEGRPCVRSSVYKASANLQTEVQARPTENATRVTWDYLPRDVKAEIKRLHPSILLDEEQYLPFPHSLGCRVLKFTESIPQIPNTPFGQPIGDILFTENFQYDQLKYFEKNEVDLARARALIPEPMWNKDDPNYDNNALNERFFQKVSSLGDDTDKITPVQFQLRGNDIKTQKETIYKDCAFKLNVSASSVASFLSEGAGARTATEIVNERTKTDTWIDSQINLNKPEIDDMLAEVMRYYDQEPVEIVFKAENQAPLLDTVKTFGDQYTAGNISPELFVHTVHKNLTDEQQKREIEFLRAEKEKQKEAAFAMTAYANRNAL